jgi:hypothetical protein
MSTVGGPRLSTIPTFTNTYSLDFDGMDDYVNAGASTLSGETALSISAWVYPTAYGDATAPSFVSTDEASPRAFYLGLYNGTNFRFSLSTNGANLTSLDTTVNTVDLNTWQHILVTWDQVNLKLYKNGVLLKTVATTFASNGTFTTTNDLLIGARRSDAGFFNGNIDEVAIFNSAISIGDVWDGSGEPTDLASLSPAAWYRMGDNGAYKSPQWLIPSNENKDKVSNYSMDFDGIDDYVDCGVITTLQNASEYSLSCWFKTSDFTKSQGILKWYYALTGWIQVSFTGSAMYFVPASSSAFGFNSPAISNDTWYNIIMVFDGAGIGNSNRLKAYLNGVELVLTYSGIVQPTTTAMIGGTFKIGERYINTDYFLGNIDEVSIFDSAISIGDVWDGSGQPIDVSAVSGLTQHYKMGEEATFSGGVWTVPDNVGSNDGTSVNMTIEDRVGEAPNSTNNALSINMDLIDRVPDTPPTP